MDEAKEAILASFAVSSLDLCGNYPLRQEARAAEPDFRNLAGAVAHAAHAFAVAGVAVGEGDAAAVAGG
jgi:hypothetical protein